MVAPTGSTKRMMRRSMWLFSKRHLKVIGNVAELRKTEQDRDLRALRAEGWQETAKETAETLMNETFGLSVTQQRAVTLKAEEEECVSSATSWTHTPFSSLPREQQLISHVKIQTFNGAWQSFCTVHSFALLRRVFQSAVLCSRLSPRPGSHCFSFISACVEN